MCGQKRSECVRLESKNFYVSFQDYVVVAEAIADCCSQKSRSASLRIALHNKHQSWV